MQDEDGVNASFVSIVGSSGNDDVESDADRDMGNVMAIDEQSSVRVVNVVVVSNVSILENKRYVLAKPKIKDLFVHVFANEKDFEHN